MFPEYSPSFIRIKLSESDHSAKKCIDLIMKEKEKKMNKSLEIEEWSDGDERIRAKNLENKLKRLSKESQSDEINNCLDKKRKSTVNEGTYSFFLFLNYLHCKYKFNKIKDFDSIEPFKKKGKIHSIYYSHDLNY